MRCTGCGLPLSPARTMRSCPRCGTPIAGKKVPSVVGRRPFFQAVWSLPERGSWEAGEWPRGLPEGGQGALLQAEGVDVHASMTLPADRSSEAGSLAQGDARWFPLSDGQEKSGAMVQGPPVQEYRQASLGGLRSEEQLIGTTPTRFRLAYGGGGKHTVGFFVAGLCVIMGGLILVLVYLMGLGLPRNSDVPRSLKTPPAANSARVPTASPLSSPTATPFPGQKYIDSAQVASAVDPKSEAAIGLTTMFKVNARIYITFQVHGGQSGAVCLLWYANGKQLFPYQLSIVAGQRTSYSYATYGSPGAGSVELYWASTTRCADKILAQRVSFTVTA